MAAQEGRSKAASGGRTIELKEPGKTGRHNLQEKTMSTSKKGDPAQQEKQQRRLEASFRSIGLTEAQAATAARGRTGLHLEPAKSDASGLDENQRRAYGAFVSMGYTEAQARIMAKGRA